MIGPTPPPRTGWPRAVGRGLAILVLLLLIGLGLWVAGWELWAMYHLRQAEKAIARRELDKAKEHLECCLEVWPESGRIHYLAGQTARRAGRHAEAEWRFTLAQRIDGDTDAIALERALTHAQEGDMPPNLERHLHDLVDENHPQTPLILEALVQGYMRSYNLVAALYYVNVWLERQPDNVYARLRRGWIYERRDNHDEALIDYRRAVEIDPDHDDARLRLAQTMLYYSRERASEAVPHFEALARKYPDNAAVILGLAQCRYQTNQVEEAERILDDLLQRHPTEISVLMERGKLALQLGQPGRAEKWLREAVRVAPNDYNAVYMLQQCCEQDGKKDEARALTAKLKALEADMKLVHELIDKLQNRPRDANLRYEVAQCLMRLGDEREAAIWLHSALQADPTHTQSHAALADYYERAGDRSLAAEHRRRAGQAGTDTPAPPPKEGSAGP